MRIGFYAPMKPPDALNPSGDRTIARLLIRVLTMAGHDVTVLSGLRTWDGRGDPALQAQLEEEARADVKRVLNESPERPDLLFTYHCHYKAPDLLGPALAKKWACPYVIAEGSFSPKRADGPWAGFHARSLEALRAATCHLVLSPRDRSGIEAAARPGAHILDLPPMLDTAPFAALDPPPTDGPVTLLTIAMMRAGEKTWSYRFLIEALAQLQAVDGLPTWCWSVVGDGAARSDIEALARSRLRVPITWHGALDTDAVLAALAGAHIFAWPGLGEGIGMVYLEAQAAGRPVLAVDGPGPAAVIVPPVGGWLTPQDPPAYAARLADLIRNGSIRSWMGAAGRNRVERAHGLTITARRLDRVLTRLVETHR
ncbi:MAG: glycosyltransferase family 4 protein [Alphaproteobacteria bacterium]